MDAEEKTAHEVRRLQSSVQDLQNALRLACRMDAAVRPTKGDIASLPIEPSASPYAHILANNDRGVLHGIERLQDIGVAVIGLNGIGALTAEAFARYGVKSLVLLDNAEITLADLSYMQFQAQDVGKRKDERLAATLRRLNPDVNVHAAGITLGRGVHDTIRVLRSAATDSGRRYSTSDNNNSDDYGDSDEFSDSDGSSSQAGGDDASDSDQETKAVKTLSLASTTGPHRLLHVVFLCVENRELASALNEFCCEFGALLVFAFVGGNGIAGEILSVAPGKSSCLQCFEKRKIFKAALSPPPISSREGEPLTTSETQQHQQQTSRIRPCLPSTECILSGLGVQNAVMQLLGFGALCSRVEYDGLLEEMDRSGFLAPVHQCPSAFCRLQQQAHAK